MPGIIASAQQAQQQPAPPAPDEGAATPNQAAAPAGGKPMDPTVERVVIAAKKILAQKEIAAQIVEMMRAAGDPVQGIAQAIIFLMKALFEKSNGSMPPQAIVPAAIKVMVDIGRLGEAAGLFKLTPELLHQAAMKAREMFTQGMQAQKGAPDEPEDPNAPETDIDPEV